MPANPSKLSGSRKKLVTRIRKILRERLNFIRLLYQMVRSEYSASPSPDAEGLLVQTRVVNSHARIQSYISAIEDSYLWTRDGFPFTCGCSSFWEISA